MRQPLRSRCLRHTALLGLTVGTVAVLCGVLVGATPPAALRSVAQNLSRAEIRSMPMLERPNRPIHVYGNAVRRRNQRAVVAPAPRRTTPAR